MFKLGLLCVIVNAKDDPRAQGGVVDNSLGLERVGGLPLKTSVGEAEDASGPTEPVIARVDPKLQLVLIDNAVQEPKEECLSWSKSTNQWVKKVKDSGGWVQSDEKSHLVGHPGKIAQLCPGGIESPGLYDMMWVKDKVDVTAIRSSYAFDVNLMWWAVLIRDCGAFIDTLYAEARWYLIPQYSDWPYFSACRAEFDAKIELIRKEIVVKLKQVGKTDLSPDASQAMIQEYWNQMDAEIQDEWFTLPNEFILRYILGPMEAANGFLNRKGGYRILVDDTDNTRSVRLLQPLGVFLTPGMGKLRKLAQEVITQQPKLVRDNALMRPSRSKELAFLIGADAAGAKLNALAQSAPDDIKTAIKEHQTANDEIAEAKRTVRTLKKEDNSLDARLIRNQAKQELDVPVATSGIKGVWKSVKSLVWDTPYDAFKRYIKSLNDPYSLVSFVDEDLLILAMGGSEEKARKLIARRAAIAVDIMYEESKKQCETPGGCRFCDAYDGFLARTGPKDLVRFLREEVAPYLEKFPDIVNTKCELGLLLMIGAAQAAILAKDGVEKPVLLENDLTRKQEESTTFKALRPSEETIQKEIEAAWVRDQDIINNEMRVLAPSN